MKKKLVATALGAVFALASVGSVFAADAPAQSPSQEKQYAGHHAHATLDAATKAKVKAIFKQEKAGTLTHDQAKTQLEALGIKLPQHQGRFANLDAATKEKVKAIRDQVKAGTLTKDEAKAQLEALGIKFPAKGKKQQATASN